MGWFWELLVSHFREELAVITGAPVIIILSLSLVFWLGFIAHRFFWKRELEFANKNAAHFERLLQSATEGKSDIKIKIIDPKEGAKVPQRLTVKGSIDPAISDIQVLIFVDETRRWYPQGKPIIKGYNWLVECNFGDVQHTKIGESFRIIAVSGAAPITDVLAELPRNIALSNRVSVYRK